MRQEVCQLPVHVGHHAREPLAGLIVKGSQQHRDVQVMHAFQEWVQQYQTANKSVLEAARLPMSAVGGIELEAEPCQQRGANDLPSGSLEAFARMKSRIHAENALV